MSGPLAEATRPAAQPVDPVLWPHAHGNVRLRDGRQGTYLGRCPVTEKHRVRVPIGGNAKDQVLLLDDYGRCRGDRAECADDVVGS